MTVVLPKILKFLNQFIEKFAKDETTTLSASLAFYTSLSLAPLLVIFVAIASLISPSLEKAFLSEAQDLIGTDAAAVIYLIIDTAKNRPDLTHIASWISVITLLLSASLIFGELRFALNKIFQCPVENPQTSFFKIGFTYIKERLIYIGLALCFVLAMIASLMASSIFTSTLNAQYWLINLTTSLLFCILFFSSLFRFIPHPRIPWPQALIGGLMTAVLFIVGKEGIGLYLGKSAVGSAYGAAGSVVVLMA